MKQSDKMTASTAKLQEVPKREWMDNKEAKARLMQSSKGELADRLLFAYATIQCLEAKLECAKNTEHAPSSLEVNEEIIAEIKDV